MNESSISPPISNAPGSIYKLQYTILVTECQENFITNVTCKSRAEWIDLYGPKKPYYTVPQAPSTMFHLRFEPDY